PSNRPIAVLVAAGVALLVGLVAVLALGDGEQAPPAAGPSSVAPVEEPTPAAPEPSTAPPPTTARSAPVSLRQVAAEFAAVLAEAQARGEVDRKTAEELRDKLGALNRGRPRDREKRVEELRKRLAEAVEKQRIPADLASRLDALLDQVDTSSRDGDEDDD
ncbi:serine/threonine protein kinase, partial [Micromonospora deserti]